ncbi:MAG: Gfo/Idh/MocA family oxidoreductase [Caldilineaceae bacterium]|nr:Gfo/Idh/MocA family oxidoreductase [Caldilineaceae bacterium]
MSLRVGIIGAGQAGERQAIGFNSVEGVSICGVADLAAHRAQEVAEPFGAPVFTDWHALLDARPDIVAVCLPHNLHVAPAEAAAARGIHVMMEKPIATNMPDARHIVDVCRAGNVKLTISFVHRFREEMQLVHGWLRNGDLGQPMLARETMNVQWESHLPLWLKSKEAAGGGVLMYSAIHGIDRLRWLMDSEVSQVTAQTRIFEAGGEVENAAAVLFTFANGAMATLTTSAPAYPAAPTIWETEVFGTAGMARARTRAWATMSNADGPQHHDTERWSHELGAHYNFARQAAAFVEAIREDKEPAVTAQDGLAALEITLAIYASSATGETIRLGQ